MRNSIDGDGPFIGRGVDRAGDLFLGRKSLDLANGRNVIGAVVVLLDTGVGRDIKTSNTAALYDAAGDRLD